ncbi:UBX domain-containing protein 4-like isoform X2 [Onthophagus taurus]|uniref:UBX domain-containing protein 4-like isoform X2 n=1 Tax=Onthophagus taurus TaxID=166361 RepID=UPI0039BE3051
MHWFQGDIAEAVTISRKNGSIFVVYVEGKCDESVKITKLIDEEQVTNELSGEHFVSIKIDAGSIAHQQFAEIYKKVNAPSIFFIGAGGVPLEIIETVQDLDDLLQKIESVKLKSGIKFTNNSQANTAVSNFLSNEQQAVECENGVCKMKPEIEKETKIEKPSSSDMPDTTTSSNLVSNEENVKSVMEGEECKKPELSKEERIEKAKEMIEKNREMKQKEEEEKEKSKEIERRKMGQDVQKMKRWQEDQEFKQMVEAREKEKKEQQAARQRVLEQIQQDKADRAAKFSNQSPTSPQVNIPAQKTPPCNSNIVRIQFKLPDGSSHNHEFTPDTKLSDLKAYIRSNIALTFNNFLLATMFPRKEFSEEDDEKSLKDLELYPSAVLLILPLSHGAVSTNSNTGIFSAFIWSVIGPILNLFSYIKGMLFGAPRPKENDGSGNGKRSTEQGESSRSPKRRAGETTAIRRQGNIHRLTDKTDSDDDNNTWNGNSTQQM